MKRNTVVIVLSAMLAAATSGCSVYMASRQPEAKDLSVLSPGTPRNQVVATLGAPIVSETRGGEKVDTFAFKQGYSRAAKTARAFFHGAADVVTLGLWEVIGTPVELIASAPRHAHRGRLRRERPREVDSAARRPSGRCESRCRHELT